MNIFDRIELVRESRKLSKGELCDELGIGRTMLHYLKTGDRQLKPANLRRLEEMEREAGLYTVAPSAPAVVREPGALYEVRPDLREVKTALAGIRSGLTDIVRAVGDLEERIRAMEERKGG